MIQDLVAGLDPAEALAVRLVDDVHRAAIGSPVLDGPERYDRLAARVQSAALSSPGIARWLTSVGRKLEVSSLHGPAVTEALGQPGAVQYQVLRVLRDETTAVCALVRALAAERREARR